MKVGLISPVVTAVPGLVAAWEQDAGITGLATIAETADRLGFHHLTCSEHVVVPSDVAVQRGATYWDPLATLGYLAARTTRIRLATQVLVLGYHHPLEIVKRYGTLDRVSNGRLVLGLGVGSLQEEFELLGAPFAGRGGRADDALRALRASLGVEEPTYSGSHYQFADVVVRPTAVQRHVPLWIGGSSLRSLQRAATLADGWVPFGLPLDGYRALLDQVDQPDGFEVVLPAGHLDPIGAPERTVAKLEAAQSAGATVLNTTIRAESVAHYVEQLEALAELGGL
ncbi:LLM class F420-dependent oxidoreductase [Nocardioides piscis]|uniref:LLM class F420-dependent oxidoreductase n=1 Tax=Nocardioides piscis TaxID=2714938 RepID=A0A6G7YH68_9ACTN|nr:LLM class F420-dependent oxidoreductase [Nocardioides piscis]QIK76120.1 LLM class F420-dependent oxidoreductase [Nocardioides piscis]